MHEWLAVCAAARGAAAGVRYRSVVPGGAVAAAGDLRVTVERDVQRVGERDCAILAAGAGEEREEGDEVREGPREEARQVYQDEKAAQAGTEGEQSGPRREEQVMRRLMITAAVVSLLLCCAAVSASAEALSPWWHLSSVSPPLQPGGKGSIVVTASNLGDAPAAAPVTVSDELPAGLEAVAAEGFVDMSGLSLNFGNYAPPVACPVVSARSVSCVFTGEQVPGSIYEREELPAPMSVPPYNQIQVTITVKVKQGAEEAKSGEENIAGVTGGAAPVSVKQPLIVSGANVPFGVSSYELRPESAGGGMDTQAGSHPFQLTTSLALNESVIEKGTLTLEEGIERKSVGAAKDLNVKLPPGLVGNPTPIPRCSLVNFLHESIVKGIVEGPSCSAQTVVGVASVTVGVDLVEGRYFVFPVAQPIYNLEPAVGEPARFGFVVDDKVPVLLTTSVPTGGDYGITVSSLNVSHEVELLSSEVTIWGVPSDARHNSSRGLGCLRNEYKVAFGEQPRRSCPGFEEGPNPPALLSMPTGCTGPLQTSVEADSWQEPHNVVSQASAQPLPAMDGCDHLPFSSSISVTPDGQQASTPTGLTVGVHIPQDSTLDAGGLSASAVRDTTVALPEGMQISSAGAGGLLACSDEQVGFTGVEAPGGTLLYTPSAVGCPDASKVGTAEVKTPLLPEPLVGAVYLAAQDANPFGSLIAMYLYAEDPVAGVALKLAGEVRLNEATGQITTTFPNSAQVPFEEAKLHFFGGDRAPLSTPALCGSYTTTASVTPWSGNEPSKSSATFEITSGPNGTPCASPRPFQPGFNAGTTSVQAGGFSPLTMTLTRPDADQALGKLDVVFPPGVSAGLRGVQLCEEPQAASGDCPAESQIGTVTVSAGLGGDPYPVETGKAYITGPYEGDPFGVDVVVPAVAGPFNLGTEVVRSKVDVDPTDAHLTVVSDAFPTMLDGIPLQLQHINVDVNRPGFVFNPTSCEPMKLTGELESSEGATANVSNPFQVTNCAALSFKPEFKVQTTAKTSRTEGASLHVTLTLPNTPRGTAANVAKVKVSLPKQLPSPLKTLQKACTEKVFAENPSNCPKASRVGEATVQTPVLEGPLSGPAYFVSHGGAKYPELIIVLVGEDGVTVQVHGETFISKAGITTATFATVPDVPFSNFELNLPEREYPALTANGNLCQAQAAGKLLMPTEMVGQNGLVIKQSTKISVTGCPKQKNASKKKAHHKATKSKRKKRRQ
jgi:hypothetical protein